MMPRRKPLTNWDILLILACTFVWLAVIGVGTLLGGWWLGWW
jgi:hypothetical protein